MKSLDPTLILEVAKEAASSHLLVECIFSSTYRYCDADVPIWTSTTGSGTYEWAEYGGMPQRGMPIGGMPAGGMPGAGQLSGGELVLFSPHPMEVESIDQSGDLGVDKVTLSLSAVNLTLVAVVLGEDVAHKTVNVYFTCLNSFGKSIATEKIFSGILTEWDLTEETLRLTLANELIAWQKKTLRTHQASCPWVFKGTECTYSGAETWCDKSYERCKQLANSDNYGGFPFLPSIKDKKVWWGRTPS
jgi:hypothetical protein